MRFVLLGVVFSLLFLAACSAKQEEIVLPIMLVVDEEFSNQYSKEDGGLLIESVSSFYRQEFGIGFVVEKTIMDWNSPELEPLPEGVYEFSGTQWLLDNAAYDIPTNGIIVVVLTATNLERRNPGMSLVTERRGFPEYYVLVWYDSENPRNALIHEIAHLFGAKHLIEEWGQDYAEKHNSVMSPHQVFETDEFDPKNRAIIVQNTVALPKLP